MRSRSPGKGNTNKQGSPTRGAAQGLGGIMGANFPIGVDNNTLTEDEINQFLKITSEKSL